MVGPEHKQLAKYLAQQFGGDCKVFTRWDELETTSAAVLEATPSSPPYQKSFGTVGLFEQPNFFGEGQTDVPIELLGASIDDRMANVLATLAFRKIKDRHLYAPDFISRDAVSMYGWDVSAKHVLITDVFSWDIAPQTLQASGKEVHFLQVLPILDSEAEFAVNYGCKALLDRVPQGTYDYLELNRESFV